MLQEFRSVGKQHKKIASKRHRLPRKEKKRLLKYLRNEFPIMFNLMRDFHGGRILALCLKEKINQYNKMKYGHKTK